MQRLRITVGVVLSLAGFAFCAQHARAEAIQAAVHLIEGPVVAGTLSTLDADVLTLSVDGQEQHVQLDNVLVIEVAPSDVAPTARSWLLLSNGDRAPLSPIDLVDDAFLCRWDNGGQRANWRVPLELVTALLRQSITENVARSLLPELSRRAFTEDTLILSDGTRLAGALEGVTPEAYRLETAIGAVPVDASRVEALALNAALIQQPEPAERSALVSLRDGAWLTVQNLAIAADGTLTGQTPFEAELKAPLADIVRISCYGPRVVDLTQREPDEVASVPFISRRHKMLVNRNVRGGWLKLGERTYARGFGMSSGMSATFALQPEDRQFQATVGLDDSVGAAGSVVFAVDVDGRRLFTSPIVRGGDAPLTIGPLDIAGGERLKLSVEFAENGHVQDVADWCEPLLLR